MKTVTQIKKAIKHQYDNADFSHIKTASGDVCTNSRSIYCSAANIVATKLGVGLYEDKYAPNRGTWWNRADYLDRSTLTNLLDCCALAIHEQLISAVKELERLEAKTKKETK
jgi:hypothetical protein